MFGIGFLELVIIAVFILIFVGPNKLPEVMRQAGKFFVHIRRTTNDVRSTFDQVIREAEDEIRQKELEELKNVLKSQNSPVDTPALPTAEMNPHSSAPEGSHHYNPYGHHTPASDHTHDHGVVHTDTPAQTEPSAGSGEKS